MQDDCEAFILCLNLIDTIETDASSQREKSHRQCVPNAIDPLWDVVNDTGLESSVGVDQDQGGEQGIDQRVWGGGHKGGDCERDHGDGDKSLVGPMEGSMEMVWIRHGHGIVGVANDMAWWLWDEFEL